ncbi:DegT/DnrJ/EryC1/StrS family aminotransferase [Actinomadura sediminis]|uniref:DegT/DnrJ/EryC1/StrS family aminotransferase n=1 Tax=Actinomadura sediminis TaxID=1038904 RepID=A0ABW3F0I4_9ACTN
MTAVPFLDLRAAYAELGAEIDAAVGRVLASGRYLEGPEVAAFEEDFAAYCGAEHCVAVGSGGDALEIALLALGIGPGDEVIVPSHTFFASWRSVSAAGARPVPVEPAEDTANLDPAGVEAAITARTRAILPVHLYGQPADLDAITAIAARHGLAVVEDAAQAHGARHRGRRIGAGSLAAAFSFYPGKNLGALGDGGAVVTSDAALAGRMRLRRSYGSRVKYRHEIVAGNSRLDELQAAVLRVKLARLDEWNARRAGVAARYLRDLHGLDGLALPVVAPWAEPVWHLFVVRSPRRDELRRRLADAGIGTQIHYPVPVHRTAAYAAAGWPPGSLPVAERLAAEVLSLPMGPHLDKAAADAVVTAVRAAVQPRTPTNSPRPDGPPST